ncbi:MAG: selenide, water dikinase SelD [Vulcanococcus sp.]|nr:selenide, water dikinase SelD [Vulcanococcus sp.]MBW0181279.1 selenide, water dikinase SelD [Vulcanococcus sp.]
MLVLAGGGHTHALLLRRWIMRPASRPADLAVLLVNRTSTALYSGMVPGLLAGLYPREACAIDLRDLCRRAGVGFVQAEITGLDPARRELLLQGRPPLRFHTLSLNVGCETLWQAGPSAATSAVQTVKPLEPFLAWLERRLNNPADPQVRIRGGGAAAVEVALALRSRGLQPELLLRGDGLQFGCAAAHQAAERLLAAAGIPIQRGVEDQAAADLACTGSRAPAWLAASGLPVQAGTGRVLTEASLMVQGCERLFASGDCAVIAADPRPPAGVWAVRAAPLLAENLWRLQADPPLPLRRWRPQRWALQLLGDGGVQGLPSPRALAVYGPFCWGPSRAIWRWKDWIDRRFMQGFAPASAMAAGAAPMACRGCAAKLPAAPLAAALGRLSPTGEAPPAEDAARLDVNERGELLLQSVDGFPALLDDPWLNARLTTLHACSDLWACGAQVRSLQAVVTLPEAAPAVQEEWLLQSLAGVRSVLDPLGATLLGGHTLEGRDGAGLGLSLAVNGAVLPQRSWPKGPLAAGQVLLLTRPIGTGVLFAAAMADAAKPGWLDAALAVMQQSQAPLVEILAAHGCQACTDITGFGLLGHLGEMLGPGQQVALDPDAIPALPGALELLEQGLSSSLAPANARALVALDGPIALNRAATAAEQQLWIDPQTCGPLLAALPAAAAQGALEAIRAAGFPQAALIGRVV